MEFGYLTKQKILIFLVPKFLLYHFFPGLANYRPSTARLGGPVGKAATNTINTLRL